MTVLGGATLEPLDVADCAAYLSWAGGGAAPPGAAGYRWLLAHSDAGVTWGRLDGGRWTLSSSLFPRISPPLRASAIQQVRFFGPTAEALIWRTAQGPRGRVLADDGDLAADNPLRPADGRQVLIGDRLLDGPVEGFSLIGDGDGSRHAVPLALGADAFAVDGGRARWWPARLALRSYFEQDAETGAVRVAVSRLVDLFVQPPASDAPAADEEGAR